MPAPLAPIHLETAVDKTARALRDWLIADPPRRTKALPPERDLAERLGVNRGTLRSALRILESEGLVSPRHGSGYTAHDYRETAGPSVIGAVLAREENRAARREIYRDLLAARRALAGVLVLRLEEQGDALDLDEVVVAIDGLDAAVREGAPLGTIARRDFDIVVALVRASGRDALLLMLNPIRDVMMGADELNRAMFRDPETNVAAWRVLVTILERVAGRSGARQGARQSELKRFLDDVLEKTDARTLEALQRDPR